MKVRGVAHLTHDLKHSSTERDSSLCNSLHNESRPGQRHILFIIDQLMEYGGAERVLLNMIRWLPSEKYRCSLLTFKLAEDFGGLQDIQCPLHVWPLNKTYDLRALKIAGSLLRFIREMDVSLVHTFFETSDLWAAPIAKLGGRVPIISSRRDMGILRHLKHSIAYRFTGKIYDHVLAVSDQVRDFCIAADHLAPSKVSTLYNGIEDRVAYEGTTLDAAAHKSSRPIVITVAHIRKVKGIDVLIDTADLVRRRFPEVRFVVVGGAHEPAFFHEMKDVVSERRLESTVYFAGELHDPSEFLTGGDIFFLPSRSEGFSNALVEAMLCKLPSVATNVGGNGEAIEEGISGFLIPPDNAAQAADRICQLLANNALRREMGNNARETALRRFTADAMINGLTRIYDEVMHA